MHSPIKKGILNQSHCHRTLQWLFYVYSYLIFTYKDYLNLHFLLKSIPGKKYFQDKYLHDILTYLIHPYFRQNTDQYLS